MKKHLLLLAFPLMLVADAPSNDAPSLESASFVQQFRDRIQSYECSNGLKAICVPYTNTNQVHVATWLGVGSAHELQHQYGMAHILEHMMFKNTKTRGEFVMWRAMQHIGATTNAHTTYDHTAYFVTATDTSWKIASEMLADSMQNLEIDPDALKSELSAVLQEVKLRNCDAVGDDLSLFYPANHPYTSHPVIGFKEQFVAYTADDVMEFYRQHYYPKNMVVLAVGNVNAAEFFEHVEATYGEWEPEVSERAQDSFSSYDSFYAGLSDDVKRRYVPENMATKSHMWKIPSLKTVEGQAAYFLFAVLQHRLTKKWVDAENRCFSVGIGGSLPGEDTFLKLVYTLKEHASIDDPQFADDLMNEMAAIARDGLSDEEFAFCKKLALRKEIFPCLEKPGSALMEFLFSFDSQRTHQSLFDCFAASEGVTALAVQSAAQDLLVAPVAIEETSPIQKHKKDMAWQTLQNKVAQHDAALSAEHCLRPPKEVSAPTYDDLAQLPQRPTPSKRQLPDLAMHTLSNGMDLVFVKHDVTPEVSISLTIKEVQSCFTQLARDKKASAPQFWSTLVKHGYAGKTKEECVDAFAARGVDCNVGSASIVFAGLTSEWRFMLDAIAGMLREPNMPDDILDRCKNDLHMSALYMKNSPMFHLQQKLLSDVLQPARPWLQLHDEQVQSGLALTRADVLAYHSLLRDPESVSVVVCGAMDEQTVIADLENTLVPLISKKADILVDQSFMPQVVHGKTSGHIELPVPQVLLFGTTFTVTQNHDLYPALLLMRGYFNQMIFNIRERTGVFYQGGGFISEADEENQSSLSAYVMTSVDNAQSVMTLLKEAFAAIHSAGATSELLDALKKEAEMSMTSYLNTVSSIMLLACQKVAMNRSFNYEADLAQRMQAVTLEQLQEAIATYFDPNAISFLSAGMSPAPAQG
jgi:predicted Zn-dependent peptidase